ncbi:serine hydrolase [Variovorax sp. H27-G14]|uniref:serine hydrolase domain-containing protein n=1 Tax=Variovorax sp. H27-G14 TaxID=3111914 RepID=UPI0038FCFF51
MDQPTEAPRPAADHTNWRTRPHSTWAFQHVREIVPVADIANDPARAAPFPTELAALDLAEFHQLTRTDGFVVLHKGRVVHEFYDGAMTAHTPHILMSATKSVVGLVAGTLHGAGLLDVAAPVSDIVPELARTAFEGATVQQLLDMRTGVALDAQALEAYRLSTGWDPAPPGAVQSDLRTFFETTTATHAPHGGPFKYTSANTDLLGLVMERVAGRPFATLASEHLWAPLGAEDAAYITVDPKGSARCTGGLCATARDLARVGWLVVQGGKAADGRAVVPAGWIDDMWHGGDAEAWNQGEFAAGFAGMRMRYRNGWYVVDDAPGMLFAMGIHGQHLFVDPRNELVIAKLSSQNQPIDAIATARTLRAVGVIRRALA